MKSKPTRYSLAVVAAAFLAGCALPGSLLPFAPEAGPDSAPDTTTDTALALLPERFAASGGAGRPQPLAWWESFADPVLNQVVEVALDSNLDLAQAVARVDQARARARIANALAYPLLNPIAGADDFDIPTDAGIGAQLDELGLGSDLTEAFGITLPERLGLTTYTLGAEFAYEVDFWGRNRNTRLAAGARRLASESDYVAASISVLAETIRTYLELVDLRRQRELGVENIALLEEREALAQSRYESGLIEAQELYATRRALRDARAGLPQLEAGLAEAGARLWILLGGFRGDIAASLPAELAIAGEPVPAGIPADLLIQRPDVAAARQRMEAARFALGARRAELLPSLSLTGSIGLRATDAGDWFDPDQWFRNLSANLLGPAIQGSRLRDNVELAEAQLNEAAAAYGGAVLTAVNEVEAALSGLEAGRRRHEVLVSFLEEARAEAALRDERYSAGIGSYGDALRAAQVRVGAEAALAAAERDLGLARLALHRALGGAWIAEDAQYLSNE
ncbi:MAG: efflux transporter outer membrane subunit [Gammaproteobacteria bacterium]|nr:efflux transporter outer membrane subunit [Gammaproteobacteria bacterium]